jgi:hypothetical protein
MPSKIVLSAARELADLNVVSHINRPHTVTYQYHQSRECEGLKFLPIHFACLLQPANGVKPEYSNISYSEQGQYPPQNFPRLDIIQKLSRGRVVSAQSSVFCVMSAHPETFTVRYAKDLAAIRTEIYVTLAENTSEQLHPYSS